MATQRVLIIGCGYLGQRIGYLCAQSKMEVFGTTRTAQNSSALKALGIKPLIFDALDSTVSDLPLPFDYVVVSLAAVGSTDEAYRLAYARAIPRVAYLFEPCPPAKFLYTSSVGIYDERSGNWVDEESPANIKSLRQEYLLAAEKAVLSLSYPSVVLRLGGIYGPKRNRIDAILQGRGVISSPGYVNLIHVEDAAQLSIFLLLEESSRGLYLGVDCEPVQRHILNGWLAEQLDVDPPPQQGGPDGSEQNKRCSNKKVLSLGYKFLFPTYREGYADLMKGRRDMK